MGNASVEAGVSEEGGKGWRKVGTSVAINGIPWLTSVLSSLLLGFKNS